MSRNLEIGAGNSKRGTDWLTSDVRPGCNFVCDAREIHKLGKFDRLYACMVLEHLGQYGHVTALKSWYEALEDGGILEIIVPDMEYIADVILGPNSEGGIYLCFGDSDDCVEQLHKWGFTIDTLKKVLLETDFHIVKLEKRNNSLYARVTK